MSLRYALLALLSKERNTGYGLGRLLHGTLRHIWEARLQQIYSELAKLEGQHMVTVESVALPNRPAKKIYSLTTSGEHELEDWLAQPPTPASTKDSLLVKLYCLERMPGEVAVRRLQERRDEYQKAVQQLRDGLGAARGADDQAAGENLAAEAALAVAEAYLSWCQKSIASLRPPVQGEPESPGSGDGSEGNAAARGAA